MDYVDFVKMKDQFKQADTEGKIKIYLSARGLDSAQYRELLTLFPLNELGKLEAALE